MVVLCLLHCVCSNNGASTNCIFTGLVPYTLGFFSFANVTGILLAVGICTHPVGNYVCMRVMFCSFATFPPGVTCQ